MAEQRVIRTLDRTFRQPFEDDSTLPKGDVEPQAGLTTKNRTATIPAEKRVSFRPDFSLWDSLMNAVFAIFAPKWGEVSYLSCLL